MSEHVVLTGVGTFRIDLDINVLTPEQLGGTIEDLRPHLGEGGLEMVEEMLLADIKDILYE